MYIFITFLVFLKFFFINNYTTVFVCLQRKTYEDRFRFHQKELDDASDTIQRLTIEKKKLAACFDSR